MAYLTEVVPEEEQSQTLVPNIPGLVEGYRQLNAAPHQVPIIFNNQQGHPHLVGLMFHDITPPDVLREQLGLSVIHSI